jgi:hypothetical protein
MFNYDVEYASEIKKFMKNPISNELIVNTFKNQDILIRHIKFMVNKKLLAKKKEMYTLLKLTQLDKDNAVPDSQSFELIDHFPSMMQVPIDFAKINTHKTLTFPIHFKFELIRTNMEILQTTANPFTSFEFFFSASN